MKEILNIQIDSIDSRGRGRGQLPDGRPVAVADGLPGDLVDARVTRRRGGLVQCAATSWQTEGVVRVAPFCADFSECGGCTWQHIGYADQLRFKEEMVRAAFRETGVPDAPFHPIVGAPADRGYRNKLEYSFGAQRWLSQEEIVSGAVIEDRRALGFHAPGRFDRVIDVTRCHLQPEPGPTIRDFVDDYARQMGLTYYDSREHRGLLRLLVIRTSLLGEVMVIVMFGERENKAREGLMNAIRETFPSIDSLHYVENTSGNDSIFGHETVCVYGQEYISERCGSLRLRVRPKAFYQTNPEQAERLYDVVRSVAALSGSDLVFDLFSGIGSIAMAISPYVRKVVSIESVDDAVSAAAENAALNGIANLEIVHGTVEDTLSSLIQQFGVPDVMVIDPPRAGMHPSVLPVLLAHGAPRIVYVSCNPRTQAHDVAKLAEVYQVVEHFPVDMFPQTRHVENVALLERREKG